MLDAVVFDFDLTLADSTAAITECSGYALRALGLPRAEPEHVHRTIGLTLAQSFVALTGRSDPALEAQYARHFISRADEVMVPGARIYPSVAGMLGSLRERGVRLGIVSSELRHRIQAILGKERLEHIVDVVLGAEDVTAHKPDPQGLNAALARLKAGAARSLYVGDHVIDAQTAARAGVGFVAVRTGATSPDAWASDAPTDIISDVGELLPLLRRTGRLG
jgi:phosphoglycolate phosphatase